MHEKYYLIYRLRGWLMVPPLVFVYLCHQGEVEYNLLLFSLGGFVFLAGLSLRIWAQMHLHYRLSNHKILTTTGPYTLVRNPIYMGNILLFLGITIASELVWFCPVILAYCAIIYASVVRHEEIHLLNKYKDDYKRYLKAVPRWLPRLQPPANAKRFEAKCFLFPSIMVEIHFLLLLLIPILKELSESYRASQ